MTKSYPSVHGTDLENHGPTSILCDDPLPIESTIEFFNFDVDLQSIWRFGESISFLQATRKVVSALRWMSSRLYWKRVIAQYWGWTVVFQICTMYTAFLDKEIFHQSPGRRSRWHWLHPLKCLCCSWCCAADLVLLCTKLRSCSSRQQSDTTDKYADQNRNLT